MILDLCAGPAGWDMGARILGLAEPIHGYDIDADACNTARTAGFLRTQKSVTDLDPEDFPNATGLIASPPCPTFSRSGKQSAVRGEDPEAIRDGIVRLGDSQAGLGPDDAYTDAYGRVSDMRTALVLEALRFGLRLPNLQWLVAEQVPAVHDIWTEMAAELAAAHDFESCHVVTVEAEDVGLASRRRRVFLIATRETTPEVGNLPIQTWWSCGRFESPRVHMTTAGPLFPPVSMARALGWPAGERINTRGARKTSGGNEFTCDKPSWCLTEKARSWKRVSDGAQLTAAQAGLLTGFPADYPWQGSRSKQFLQAADVVSPPVAAAVLGAALGVPWEAPVRDYLTDLYPAGVDAPGVFQPSLFEEVA
ncbi:DNA cytosine methyltransferase [Streptosporangium canum]|uniref:DNA cytosine methyltransferase n=1 Tax=Streptosporangium canum TaxID=324952 RepID=UPI0034191CB1